MAASPSNSEVERGETAEADTADDRRIRLVVEYDGTDFVGWQRQLNGPSIQGSIEEATRRLTGMETSVVGAGRTDAGVHALGQVAAFTTRSRLSLVELRRGLNALLPRSIAVCAVDEVPRAFDPRRDACGKLYRYQVWNAEARSPLLARTSWHVRHPLDAVAMQAAANLLVGEHDFSAFRAADCERRNPVRLMRRLEILRQGHRLNIETEATAFLKHMVRIIVGTLVDVGRGYLPAAAVGEILASRDRTRAGPTAPPLGLQLVRVDYDLPLPDRV